MVLRERKAREARYDGADGTVGRYVKASVRNPNKRDLV